MHDKLYHFAQYIIEIVLTPLLFIIAIVARSFSKAIDVGIGPDPLINNVYHKQALELYGYTAQTFVTHTYFCTDQFDIRIGKNNRLMVITGEGAVREKVLK